MRISDVGEAWSVGDGSFRSSRSCGDGDGGAAAGTTWEKHSYLQGCVVLVRKLGSVHTSVFGKSRSQATAFLTFLCV